MTMKVNVMYRGIIYRVRGMKVLCSVVTAVIVLLIAIVALGIWMLVTAYSGEKYNPSANTTSIAGLTMNLELNRTTQATSTVPGMDFNAPSSTLQDAAIPTHDPSSSEERDLVNEAVGLLAGATPGKTEETSPREAGPDPAFGLFSGLLDLGLGSEETSVDLPVSPVPIPGTWNPLQDNVVELSNSRPIIVEAPPREFNISGSNPADSFNRRADSDVLTDVSYEQSFNPSSNDKGQAGYAPSGAFGTSFTNSFPFRPEGYEVNYENMFPAQPIGSSSGFVNTGAPEGSSILSASYRPTDISNLSYNNVRRLDTFQEPDNQRPGNSGPRFEGKVPLLTINRQEFSNRYSGASQNPQNSDYTTKGQVDDVEYVQPYNRQPSNFEYTDGGQNDRNSNTGTRYSDDSEIESSVIFDPRLRPNINENTNQYQQYDENLDYYESEYQGDNVYDQTNRRSDNYETELIDRRRPDRQGSNNRPIFASNAGIPPGIIPQNMDPNLLGAGLPLPGMFGLGGLMNQRVRGGQPNINIQNAFRYPNRQQQQSFVERQGTINDMVNEDTNDEQGYENKESDSEYYDNTEHLSEKRLNDPSKSDFNYYEHIQNSGVHNGYSEDVHPDIAQEYLQEGNQPNGFKLPPSGIPHGYSEDLHPDIPQEYLQGENLPNGFKIPPGFKIPSNVQANLPMIPGRDRGNKVSFIGGPGSHMQDMLYYYNKHEKSQPTTETTEVFSEQNHFNNRPEQPQDHTHQNYSGPDVVGYGNQPFRVNQNQDRKEIFEHFMNVYDATGSTPGIHEDRGPGPAVPQPYDAEGRRPNRGPGIADLTSEGHNQQLDKNGRRVDSNSNSNSDYHISHISNPFSQLTTIIPKPNLRGPRPNGEGYGHLATRPDAQSPAHINLNTEDAIMDAPEFVPIKPQIPNFQIRPTGEPEPDLQLRPGTYRRPANFQRPNSQQRPEHHQRPNDQQRPGIPNGSNSNLRPNGNQRPNGDFRPAGNTKPSSNSRPNGASRPSGNSRPGPNSRPGGNSRPSAPNRPNRNNWAGNRPNNNPDRRLWTGPSNPQQDLSIEEIPDNHRPFLGPLHDIFEYSKKLASSLLGPFYPVEVFKNSTNEYMKNTVELLEDYNKVFKSGDVTGADVLPDMFDDRPDRNERLMLLETEELESLGPIEMTLITWTFLDFWEFMIEKVGTLSKDDLRILENRLERLRKQKDKALTKTIINATIAALPNNGQLANISQALALSEQRDLDSETEEFEGRMWDPLGLFDSQQKVQFMEFAIQVLFKFGRVYLRKQYALDCMMLLFCKDLNSKSKQGGMDALAAKIKSVGLKVLTVREERDGEMDTIGEIWRALTAWDTMQCDAMFPKCDGTKALEIVNEVALGE